MTTATGKSGARSAAPAGQAGRRARAANGTGPRAVAREARENLYREHILIAAERVFADQGFDAAKVQDISRLAGLSMGSIYTLFPGKEQLFASIIDRRGNELLALARSVVAEHADPVRALEELARAYVAYFHEHPDFLRMHLRTGTSWALQPAVGARRALSEKIHALQADIFARGVASGAFIDEDPAYLAVLFSGIDQAHLSQWVASGMPGSLDDLSARFLRIVGRTFLRSAAS
ncbi:MAG TPA: TetR/AcrR family transcriptional regulator [Candidatus Binatia bacterium]|nr:TetR/AcrR family transcriptional regulator [Candidatus Binatia bacterium]